MYQTIFHCDNQNKAEKLFNNVENLLSDMSEAKEEVEVEILVNSSAVQLFKKGETKYKEKISSLSKKDVQIALCQNSLNSHSLSESKILDEVKIVSSGVGELSRKQHQGWSYIKV